MKTSSSAFVVLALNLLLPLATSAAMKKQNPTSKVYVADLSGISEIDTGERIETLTKKSVYSAEGTSIKTRADSTDSLVLSNGTALYVAANTSLEVKKFLQEPFTPNRNDLDAEPSISQTIIKMSRGSLGICTSKLVAGSSMSFVTPHATITVRGRKVMIEVTDNETIVSLLEGDITVQSDTLSSGQNIKPGQQVIIRKPSSTQPAKVLISPIPDEAQAKLDETVSLACISRRTVFFEVVGREGQGEAEIVPVDVIPTNPPPGFTVSPATI